MTDLFPPKDFDGWAENYDQSVTNTQEFPFTGYENALDKAADITFPYQAALEAVKRATGDEWEDEFYWLANESTEALKKAGLRGAYIQVSSCAGVFEIAGS